MRFRRDRVRLDMCWTMLSAVTIVTAKNSIHCSCVASLQMMRWPPAVTICMDCCYRGRSRCGPTSDDSFRCHFHGADTVLTVPCLRSMSTK